MAEGSCTASSNHDVANIVVDNVGTQKVGKKGGNKKGKKTTRPEDQPTDLVASWSRG